MATLAAHHEEPARDEPAREEAFFASLAIVMALVIVAGFSTQFLAGRSSFASPPRVHFHAIAFMGWTAIFVAQSWLATRGPLALHRKLGWIAVAWMAAMIAAALLVIVAVVRNGTAPFFFQPQHFLIANPLSMFLFVGLTLAAVRMRHRTDWHARLHISGMTMIMGPGFGRLLPMPLLVPYAFQAAVAAAVVFPLAGMIRDVRKYGQVHPAWYVCLACLAALIALPGLLAPTRLGDGLYRAVTAGSAGAAIPGMAFAPPPGSGSPRRPPAGT
jgi:hypothetical protein